MTQRKSETRDEFILRNFSRIKARLMMALEDGEPHTEQELMAAVPTERRNTLAVYVNDLRRQLRGKFGTEFTIITYAGHDQNSYQIVRQVPASLQAILSYQANRA